MQVQQAYKIDSSQIGVEVFFGQSQVLVEHKSFKGIANFIRSAGVGEVLVQAEDCQELRSRCYMSAEGARRVRVEVAPIFDESGPSYADAEMFFMGEERLNQVLLGLAIRA